MLRASRFSAFPCACILGALLLGHPIQSLQAQSSWDRYKPGTLAAIMRAHDSTIRADHVDKKTSLIVSGDDFPTITRVIYRGDSRPLDSRRREVLREWGLSFLKDSLMVQEFHREYLFQEGQRLLWLPVQDGVAGYLARELRSGQPVTLYVIWLGAYYAGGDITWAFIVNEFTTRSTVQ